MKDCRPFSGVEGGDEKFSRRGLLSALRDGQTPEASVIHLSMFWALNILQSYNQESNLPMQTLGLLPAWLLGCSSPSLRSVRLRGAVFCP